MDIITSQLIRSSMQYASEEMGIALRNSSYSPNIKERMDHSAALFDPKARLFAQAEHIPVHLGSLPWGLKNTVEYCEREGLQLEEGSMVVVNNPYIAGTHLNDITVVKPIFYLGRLVGFAANKAHHADVGGKVPGSISVDASTLYEEGLIVNPVYLMRDHEFVRETLTLIASNTRTPTERLGDLKAQAAANITGERRVLELISKHGLDAFLQASEIAFDYTERLLRSRIAEFEKGTYSVQDYLEHPDGRDITLRLTLKISDDSLTVDYEGTDKQVTIPLKRCARSHAFWRSFCGESTDRRRHPHESRSLRPCERSRSARMYSESHFSASRGRWKRRNQSKKRRPTVPCFFKSCSQQGSSCSWRFNEQRNDWRSL